jgi:hypothetical protein
MMSFSEETAIPVPMKKSEIPFSLQTKRLAVEALQDRLQRARQALASDLFASGDADEAHFRVWMSDTQYRGSIAGREVEAVESYASYLKARANSIREMEAALKELKEVK